MAYLVCFLVNSLGLLMKKSKIVTVLLLSYMWILLGLNTYTPDYEVYQFMYNNSGLSIYNGYEPLYILSCKICREIGLNFQQYRMIYALAYVIILYLTIKSFIKNINFALVLFFIFPFLSFISGLRQTMAMLLVCFAIKYLLINGKQAIIKYVVVIVLASLFHYAAIFYIIFLLAKGNIKSRTITLCLCIFLPIFLMLTRIDIPSSIISTFTTRVKITGWFSGEYGNRTTFIGFLVACVVYAISTFLFIRATKSINTRISSQDNGVVGLINSRSIKVLYNTKLLMLFSLPLLLMQLEFFRLFYGYLLVDYLIFAWSLENEIDRYKRHFKIFLAILWSASLFFYYIYGVYDHLTPTLVNNMLFGG